MGQLLRLSTELAWGSVLSLRRPFPRLSAVRLNRIARTRPFLYPGDPSHRLPEGPPLPSVVSDVA